MAERIFFDTNVLVYAHDGTDSRKQQLAASNVRDAWDGRTGVFSTQVLQEFYVTATRKWAPVLARSSARALVATYAAWDLITVDAPMILAASELEEKETLSFWDALIVEAAKRAGAAVLLTEDLQDGRSFDGLRVVNPFSG